MKLRTITNWLFFIAYIVSTVISLYIYSISPFKGVLTFLVYFFAPVLAILPVYGIWSLYLGNPEEDDNNSDDSADS